MRKNPTAAVNSLRTFVCDCEGTEQLRSVNKKEQHNAFLQVMLSFYISIITYFLFSCNKILCTLFKDRQYLSASPAGSAPFR